MFVTNRSSTPTLKIVSGATSTVSSALGTTITPWGVSVNPSTGIVYIAETQNGTVAVVEGIAGGGGTTGTSPGTAPVNPGVLSFVSVPANITFPALTLSGENETTSVAVPIDVGDNTGSGAGWNVTITSTQFSDGSATLPASSTSVNAAPSASCDAGSSCTPATLSSAVTYPVTIPAGSTAPTATRLHSAPAGSGTGDQT